jgi:hypothetical protein
VNRIKNFFSGKGPYNKEDEEAFGEFKQRIVDLEGKFKEKITDL